MDEHRLGLKPITRRIWSPIGERPIAKGHHRFEWLYVTGFVEPATGRTVWNVSTAISKEMFELILADFAQTVGAGASKRIVLQLDNAGWHGPENLAIPDGVRLVFQPAHSPELQPAEHLWEFVDEPLVNTYFESLEALDQTVGALHRPHASKRNDPRQHPLPLAAETGPTEVITRRWCHVILLGEERGPRPGSFIALYEVDETRELIDKALAGDLVRESQNSLPAP